MASVVAAAIASPEPPSELAVKETEELVLFLSSHKIPLRVKCTQMRGLVVCLDKCTIQQPCDDPNYDQPREWILCYGDHAQQNVWVGVGNYDELLEIIKSL